MSVQALREKYENEARRIEGEKERLSARARFLDRALAEIRKAGGPSPARKPKATRKSKKRKKGMTASDAIMKVVADASGPLAPKEILEAAGPLSGGATASLRTRINTLAKEGALEQVPHEGRGYLYRLPAGGGTAPAKKEPAPKKKAPAKKKPASKKKKKKTKKRPAKKRSARKKKAPAKKKGPAKKKAAAPAPEAPAAEQSGT